MHQQKREKHSTRFWLIIAAVIIAPIAMLMLYKMSCKSGFDRRVAALRAEGFPVSLDDLEKTYALDEGVENAADIYIEAFSYYQEPTEDQMVLLPHLGKYEPQENEPPFPKEVIDAIQTHIQQNRKTLDLLEKAAKIEHCVWPRTRNEYNLSLEQIGQIKYLTSLLCEQNLFLAHIGDSEGLFNSIQTSIALANSFSKPSSLFARLVINVVKSLNSISLEEVMSQITFNEEQMAMLQKQFAEMHKIKGFHDSLVVEQCYKIEFWRLPPDEHSAYSDGSKPLQILYSGSGLKRQEALLALDYMGECIAASQLPLHERYEAFEEINVKFHDGLRSFVNLYYDGGTKNTETRSNRIDLLTISAMRNSETALAIERYRRKHNTLPDSLEALVPEFMEAVPHDPWA